MIRALVLGLLHGLAYALMTLGLGAYLWGSHPSERNGVTDSSMRPR